MGTITTILFLAAEPSDFAQIRLGEEVREIEDMLRMSKLRDRFRIEKRFAVRAQDLAQALLDLQPQIVHFSGHGSEKGICLENAAGEASTARPEAVARLFKQFPNQISCVVLNACQSERQAKAIAPHVGYVVGTRKNIGLRAAIAFSKGFYQALGSGKGIPECVEMGRTQIGLEGIREQTTPVLIKGSGGKPLDVRPVSHIPIIVGMGCSDDEFKAMSRDAVDALSDYDFSEDRYRRQYNIDLTDLSVHRHEWLPTNAGDWKELALSSRTIVGKAGRQISGAKVFHFFLRAPITLTIGLGASIGTKYEVIFHHHQPGGHSNYIPLIDVSGGQGAHLLRTRPAGRPKYIRVTGAAKAKGVVYAAIALAPSEPAPVKALARSDGASYVEIRSIFGKVIPADADWTLLARELNMTLLDILATGDCTELHLFTSAPMPLTFAMGMALDTRPPVVVHHWFAPENKYAEVLRLNELGTGKA